MEFDQVVRRRRMVRNYTDEPVSDEQIDKIMRTASKTPSAGFSQGQSFVVVTDPSLRREVAEICGEPSYIQKGFDPWISKAPVLVVCCTTEALYRERYAESDKLGAGGQQIDWPVPYWFIDAGCSMMMLLLAAVDGGLAAGFLGADKEGYAKIHRLLSIPDETSIIGIVTMGHPAPDRKSGSLKRGWRPISDVVHRNGW